MRANYTLARFYVSDELSVAASVKLSPLQAHKLYSVLRKQAGDALRLFNGRDGEWQAEITHISKRDCLVEIKTRLRAQMSVPDIQLLFAPLRKERTRFIVEKATELGVRALRPVLTARTQHKVRLEKMRAYIIEAAEQTERLDLPELFETQTLAGLVEAWEQGRALLFADEAGGPPAREVLAQTRAPCALLIGPEGGFMDDERQLLRDLDFVRPLSLGPRILRADTAAVATLALWQALSGDWG
ncbi:MAG TPA: 16S rRNA (uracil(1498)-N(3))-methyltransferase [Hellea balneolensis]|uniref:Ribosomal RNA small subunit methyltransferase E n=1 Tax=Hellea balneolensis TaxID=287478 RepID=A0A7V5NW86_9PROT|nr:16S rRNA (uracil(1498)-N(3))-methyltransferase [Hellea balneolensis]